MTIKVGDKVPSAKFKYLGKDGMAEMTTDDLFKGKKVVLFAVPGAFTPTCSAKHLPGFLQHIDEFKKKGIDAVACVSVNDAFVMDSWAKNQKVDNKVLMLADGNGDFAKATGLELDASGFGMGLRSKRYAMIVDNGVVKELNIEKPGAFEVSSAEYVLKQL